MKSKSIIPATVDEYIDGFPPATQKLLKQMRATIKKNAKAADESISYQMPAYKLEGVLVYFAGYAKHIGFYPGAGGIAAFKKELASYKSAKGSVQFPLDQPLPLDLVSRIVQFRVKENLTKVKIKTKKSKIKI